MEKNLLSDEKHTVARIKSYGKHFEIFVVTEKALEIRKTGKGNILNAVEFPGIFSDLKKGIKVKDSELEEVFGTIDVYKIAEKIIKEGEIQLPASYKEQARDMKYKQVVDWLVTSCTNPQGIPYTPEKIKSAMEQAGARVEDTKHAEEQAIAVLKLLQKVIPIKFATKRLSIKIPAQFTGKLYGYLKDFILKEEWLSDGSLSCAVEIPAKLQSEFYDKLNSATHGSAITKDM